MAVIFICFYANKKLQQWGIEFSEQSLQKYYEQDKSGVS
jgi:hypothetical protein